MRLSIVCLLLFSALTASAQDTFFVRKTIEQLCSKQLHGRGYYRNGAVKTAKYLSEQFKTAGLEQPGNTYLQNFQMSANTFTGNVSLEVDGVKLIPGRDFQVEPNASRSRLNTNGLYPFITIPLEMHLIIDTTYQNLILDNAKDHSRNMPNGGAIYVIDTIAPEKIPAASAFIRKLKQLAHTVILVKNKLTWSVATEQSAYVSFEVLRKSLDSVLIMRPISKVKWKIKSKLIETTQHNVIGLIPGIRKPDSIIYITAHYDHLGQMGKKTIYPGANDNAAGVAMLLDLAKHYRTHQPEYTMVFIAFAGEEAGLLGSYYYVTHPVFPLSKTKFLLNLDLVGTGEEGMTVVNASVFKKEFKLLNDLNEVGHFLPKITSRGKAANSDHYFFSELGIPAFFWYQQGPRSSYHDIYDVPQTLTLAGYITTFMLARDFLNALQSGRN